MSWNRDNKKRKEKIEIRNNADALVHSTEKTLEELGDKFTKEDKETIESGLKDLREALTGDDLATIKEKTEKLQEAFQKASQVIYQQAAEQYQANQQTADAQTESNSTKTDDKTINADFKVKDDEKKDTK